MSRLSWDETDFLECLEVVPETEEYEISHTYSVEKSSIGLVVKVWQLESIIELELINQTNSSVISSYAILVRNGAEFIKSGNEEYLLFKNSLVLPSRFSYLDLGGAETLEESSVGYNIKLSVNPDICIEYLRENT